MPGCKTGPAGPSPKREPEVEARLRLRQAAATIGAVTAESTSMGFFRACFTVVGVVFTCGLALGSCAAGVWLPIRGVNWLFGG